MHVWNVLQAARWKYRTQKWLKNSPSGHHRTYLSGYIFATKSWIDNRKNDVKQQYHPHMSLQYGEIRPTSGWDRFVSLGHPSKFLGSDTARYSSIGRQQNFAVLNRGRHLYSAGRPSRWAPAHIPVVCILANKNVIEWTSILHIFRRLTYINATFTVADVRSWLPLGVVIKVAITSTKLPPSRGCHIKIYPIDMGDYKNITRFCHIWRYQKWFWGVRPIE